uniref:Uncharacterized protein n=1 Tax=Fagus sylvatica TaxID=28930 RepID=A0A2N9IB03_FAGSY
MDFSESEMDVAEQLIQLSGDSEEGKADVADADVSSSSTNGEIFFSINNNNNSVEEDEFFWPRKRKFRSIYHLYRCTKPVTAVVNVKTRRKFTA